MAELNEGIKIKDRYTLKEFKGSGSFGEVWLAHDEILDCDVAIKVYISLDPRGVEEFKREYITTQGISHPNLLTTTYFDVWNQRPYLVMKYCEKGSSSKFAGKIDEYALWQFIHDVAAGLKYLHNIPEPIIHQDIKPDNILVDDNNRYLITDFGISKKIRSTMRKQSKRAVGAGATAYMGPERFDSDPTPVKASDIWSLGASIYELATGELPFNGLGGGMQRNGAVLPVLDNKWSKDMTMVMQSCLAKETWDRPTAEQLEKYSESILKGEPAKVTWNAPKDEDKGVSNPTPVPPAPEPVVEEEVKSSNRNRILIALGCIIVAVIVLVCIWPSSENYESVNDPIAPVEEVIPDETVITKPKENIEVPEVKPKEEPKNNISQEKQQKQIETSTKSEESNSNNNAALLKSALAEGDYQQVQRLANQGYAAAYAPLAKYYLNNHDYKTAESYAQKAKAAGFSEGSTILKTLENLGYYD